MGAIDQRRMRGFQRFRRRDIGEYHEFLDEPVRVEPFGPAHALQLAVGIEDELALGQIEIERIALAALLPKRVKGGVERLQGALQQRPRRRVGCAVDRTPVSYTHLTLPTK